MLALLATLILVIYFPCLPSRLVLELTPCVLKIPKGQRQTCLKELSAAHHIPCTTDSELLWHRRLGPSALAFSICKVSVTHLTKQYSLSGQFVRAFKGALLKEPVETHRKGIMGKWLPPFFPSSLN